MWGSPGSEQGHVTLLRPQNVSDGFKQCHLKAPYVTEKQIGEGEEDGKVGNGKHPLERPGLDLLQGQGLPWD